MSFTLRPRDMSAHPKNVEDENGAGHATSNGGITDSVTYHFTAHDHKGRHIGNVSVNDGFGYDNEFKVKFAPKGATGAAAKGTDITHAITRSDQFDMDRNYNGNNADHAHEHGIAALTSYLGKPARKRDNFNIESTETPKKSLAESDDLADIKKQHTAAVTEIGNHRANHANWAARVGSSRPDVQRSNPYSDNLHGAIQKAKGLRVAYKKAGGNESDLSRDAAEDFKQEGNSLAEAAAKLISQQTELSEMGDKKGNGVLHHFRSEKDVAGMARQKELLNGHKKGFEEAMVRRNRALAKATDLMTPDRDRSTHLAMANQAHGEAQEHAKEHTKIMNAGRRYTHKPHASLYGEFESKMPKSTPRQEFDKSRDHRDHRAESNLGKIKRDHAAAVKRVEDHLASTETWRRHRPASAEQTAEHSKKLKLAKQEVAKHRAAFIDAGGKESDL